MPLRCRVPLLLPTVCIKPVRQDKLLASEQVQKEMNEIARAAVWAQNLAGMVQGHLDAMECILLGSVWHCEFDSSDGLGYESKELKFNVQPAEPKTNSHCLRSLPRRRGGDHQYVVRLRRNVHRGLWIADVATRTVFCEGCAVHAAAQVTLTLKTRCCSLRFKQVELATAGKVKLKTNLVGACDSNSDVLHFIDINHKPRHSANILLVMSF